MAKASDQEGKYLFKIVVEDTGSRGMEGLWPHQERALADIRATVRGGCKRLVVQAPTGAGKTKLAAAIMEGAISKGHPAAFVVPSISLIDQTLERFWDEDIRDVGVIQANHNMTDWSKPIQICSIQTIRRRGYPKAAVVLLDEIHQFHQAHRDWLTHPDWQTVPFIGLSATPWTPGLGKYFESLLSAATLQELIDQGFLSKFRVFGAGHPDLSEVKIVAGDYHEGQLSGAMQKGSLTADIIKTYQEMWGKGKTLCFCVDRAHAKSVQERFEYAGIPCGYQDADTPPNERAEIKRKFHRGDYQVVANIQTLTTGVDWDVRCLILARPTRSEMLYVQIVGRALRTAEGKDQAVILDHSDTTQRLGFVTDIHHEELSRSKEPSPAVKKVPLPKECPKCTALRPAGKNICPNCGFEAKPVSRIVEGNGMLVEMERHKKTKGKKREYTMREKEQFYAELKKWASIKGYSDGWAAHKYKTKFGVWPDNSLKWIVAADVVSPDVYIWIRAQNVKWGKIKARAAHV